jgi:signal transduction histidine kinase
MEEHTLSRIFEPSFTTKEKGEGNAFLSKLKWQQA